MNEWAKGASINILNILPRVSIARNYVINDLNMFIRELCRSNNYSFINTESERNMFSVKEGYRKNHMFNVVGSDNVHPTMYGIAKLGAYLKYRSHIS